MAIISVAAVLCFFSLRCTQKSKAQTQEDKHNQKQATNNSNVPTKV